MQLHVTSSFFTSSPQNYTGVFTQPRRQKYVQGRRTTDGTLTLRERAAFVAQSLSSYGG
jgi:hypothetical protein